MDSYKRLGGTRVRPTTTQLPVQWVTRLLRGISRPERGVDHPFPSSAEVAYV